MLILWICAFSPPELYSLYVVDLKDIYISRRGERGSRAPRPPQSTPLLTFAVSAQTMPTSSRCAATF